MKKVFCILLLSLVFCCQQKTKIAFVDNGEVINNFQAKKDLEAKFKLKEESFKKKFDSIDQAFKLEIEKSKIKASKLSQKKAQMLYQELSLKKQKQDQQKQLEAQQFQKEFQTEVDSIIAKVKAFVKQYGKANQYTYILGTSDAAATVLYGAKENDLTQTILDAINKAYKN